MNEQTDTPETGSKVFIGYNYKDFFNQLRAFTRQLERKRNALRKELSKRKAQVEDFQSLYAKAKQDASRAEEENNALRAEVEKLKADSLMMDWLEKQGCGLNWSWTLNHKGSNHSTAFLCRNTTSEQFLTVRSLIAAEMKGDK
jgi:predicted nuclease with TOPRIM domain